RDVLVLVPSADLHAQTVCQSEFFDGENCPVVGRRRWDESLLSDRLEIPAAELDPEGTLPRSHCALGRLQPGLPAVVLENRSGLRSFELGVLVVGASESRLEAAQKRERLGDLTTHVEPPLFHLDVNLFLGRASVVRGGAGG